MVPLLPENVGHVGVHLLFHGCGVADHVPTEGQGGRGALGYPASDVARCVSIDGLFFVLGSVTFVFF